MRVVLLIIALCVFLPGVSAQQPAAKPQATPAQPSDVVTVNTELVQTDVMVFDKAGHLVEGLSPDEFVLTLDGKPRPISFFESVKTGSSQEASQVTSTKSTENRNRKVEPPTLAGVTRPGRVILFLWTMCI